MAEPELHAMLEIEVRPGALWFRPPAEPWPRFIRLWASTPVDHVALFLVVASVASSYGRVDRQAAASIADVLTNFPSVLPGGIGVVFEERGIMPSCCCGLEHWPEWRRVLTEGQSPWTGHDPAPLVEVLDAVHIWSDGGVGSKPSEETPITFTRQAFALAVEAVQQDLVKFLLPLRAWLDVHAPRASDEFVAKFAERFVRV